jgi:DNA-directed RNA polymerase subunit RPC12/RpoP
MAVRSKIEGLPQPRGSEALKRAVDSSRVSEPYAGNASSEGSCPHCGGKTLDKERRQGLFDSVMRIVRLRPYRCRRCYHRFYGRAF